MLISVITTFYNSENYILECIKSFQKINNQNIIEHLLVDDGSSDRTHGIINANKRDNQNIIGKEKLGRGAALNLGIHKAKGKYICILDADDILNPNWINFFIDAYEKQKLPNNDIFFGDVVHFSNNDNIVFKSPKRNLISFHRINTKNLYFRNPIPHVGSIILKSKLKEVNCYSVRRTAQFDWDLWLRLDFADASFAKTSLHTAGKRLHPMQSYERRSHFSYTLKGINLQIYKTILQKTYLLPLVIIIAFIRMIWSIFPQSFRARFYR